VAKQLGNLVDKVAGEGAATPLSQDSSDIQPTYGEVFREIVSTKVPDSNTPDSSAVERPDGGRG
jgi:hypothetical protein